MEVLHIDGVFSNIENIELAEYNSCVTTQRDYTKSSFTLTLGDKHYDFIVSQVEKSNCGSYEIQLIQSSGADFANGGYMHMVLSDHSYRVCEDLKPYAWESLVTFFPYKKAEPPSRLDIAGNPR